MNGDRFRSATEPSSGRWLVCVELQRDNAVGLAPFNGLSSQLDNCRALLAHARQTAWSVIHVHIRRRSREVGSADRPIIGFEPLPSEAVFFRDEGLGPIDDAFWRLARSAAAPQALVVGFINDPASVDAVAALSSAGAQVTLIDDALGGGYARTRIERRVRSGAAGDFLPGLQTGRRPAWLQAANTP